jgi:hypothetical protein
MNSIKRFIQDFSWLKILFSPFKTPRFVWYAGRSVIGTPYFAPRRVVKSKTKKGYLDFVPIKVGFDYCRLGWKTKWADDDYRHEWNPVITFVFFGYQIALTVTEPIGSYNYWEAWLYYSRNTKGTKVERIKQCRKEFPLQLTAYFYGTDPVKINAYETILKTKYLQYA